MNQTTTTEAEIDRYWKLARKSHTNGWLTTAERAELRKLSRKTDGAYHA